MLSRYSLWTLLTASTLTVMAGSIIVPVINMMREALDVDVASIGFVITAYALFIAIFSPVMGILVDRVGTRRPLIFGLVLYGLAGGSGLFITSYWPMIVSRALFGIGVAAIFTSITVIILNSYQGKQRNKVMGWRISANSFGGVIWPLIGGALGALSWNLPFAVYMVAFVLALVVWRTIPDIQPVKTQDDSKPSSLSKVFRKYPVLYAIYGLTALASCFVYVTQIFLAQLLETVGISSPFYISLFVTAFTLSFAFMSFMYGRIRTRLSYRAITFLALGIWAVGFTAVSQLYSGWLIGIATAFVGIGHGMVVPMCMIWTGETVPPAFRGRVTSYIGTCVFAAQFLAPVIFAPVVLSFGLRGVFLASGGFCALVSLGLLAVRRKRLVETP